MKTKQRLITEASRLLELKGDTECAKCKRREYLTVDHVVPVKILRNFGLTLEEMYSLDLLVVLCRPCNSLKADNLDFNLPQTKEVLLKLLTRF